ncbi:MAG TPA: ribosome small subunit-dependent GTPase A [Lachnospiraceae bacterium]|nr:ribosome small subunit-dependent GTPase A [Lachnospiraceae bacterium]
MNSDRTGKIIRVVGGFYYVWCREDGQVYQCRARGAFRKDSFKPVAGDDCSFRLTKAQDVEGYVEAIAPRRNLLIRPPVANVDQALILFAFASPEPNYSLLDRFLIEMRRQEIPSVICFNKHDLAKEADRSRLAACYSRSGCTVLTASILNREGLEEIRGFMKGKTTVLAGPSGVGKSSLTNFLCPDANMEVGQVSRKTERGKQTTRHAELFAAGDNTFFFDTPGFSSLELAGVGREEIKEFFPEFTDYEPQCRFQGCMHIHEPDCGVKEALENGLISRERYDSYVQLVGEASSRRRY